MKKFINLSSIEISVVIVIILLLLLIIFEIFNFTNILGSRYHKSLYLYGYKAHNGPHTWKCKFPESRGKLQSPINIYSRCAIIVPAEILTSLNFTSEYHLVPDQIKVCNNGMNVSVFGSWCNGRRPKVFGGPLTESYDFYAVIFRWGPTNVEGTEHTVDSKRYAMEAQAMHIRSGANLENEDPAKVALFISYFYEVTSVDNPYIDPLISILKYIREPFSSYNLIPIPLAWLIPPFASKYYTYLGSLTEPPCTEGVKWIVQPEPLSISERQINKFRKLMSADGSLDSNTRPVQNLNDREIFYYG